MVSFISIMSMFMLIYIFSLLTLIIQRSHLLMSLLALEAMMLSLVLLIPILLYWSGLYNMYLTAIIMLTLGACEASLGLSIMVNMSRSFGSDMMSSLTTNKW